MKNKLYVAIVCCNDIADDIRIKIKTMDTTDTTDSIQIFLCTVCFRYSQYYIEVVLMAENEKEAKDKFISKCLEKYDKIVSIDFMQFYDGGCKWIG